MPNYKQKIDECAAYIQARHSIQPKIGLILGTGLGQLADQIENPVILAYQDLPHFPRSTVVTVAHQAAMHLEELLIQLLPTL